MKVIIASVVLVLFLYIDDIEQYVSTLIKEKYYRYLRGRDKLKRSIESKGFSLDGYIDDLNEVASMRAIGRVEDSRKGIEDEIALPSPDGVCRKYTFKSHNSFFDLKPEYETTDLYEVCIN